MQRELVSTLWKVTERIKGNLERDLTTQEISSGDNKIVCLAALKWRSEKIILGKK